MAGLIIGLGGGGRASSIIRNVKEAINKRLGVQRTIPDSELASAIENIPLESHLEVEATTVRTSASTTENVATNDHIRILGSDNKKYTLAEWNAMFVEAGYSKDNMTVTPIGLAVDAFGNSGESYLFDRYEGVHYNPVGDSAATAGSCSHSLYNHTLVTAAGNGTDYTTSKAWSVTKNGDVLTLYEANTKQSWTMKTDCGGINAHRAFNIEDRTHSLWAQTEWMRHRMAITSGVATTKADGTMGEIQILNSSGAQAAANEDMYFWVKNDSGTLVNTNILAKYNLNNLHGVNSASLTSTIRDAIYARQKANGINMNDTGVNSASKSILFPGSKGAEVIAVDGYWFIITPYISNPNATTSIATNNMADSPAVYWAKYKGCSLPSDTLLFAIYDNKTLCDAIISYLNNKEGRSISVIPIGTYTWSCVRFSATYAWFVYMLNGILTNTTICNRYCVVGALTD